MNLNSTASTCIKNLMWHLESLRKIAIIGPESVSVRGDMGSCGIFLCQSHSVFGFGVSFKFQLPITLFLILSAQLDTNSPLVSFKWKQIQAWLFCQLRMKATGVLAVVLKMCPVKPCFRFTGFKSLSSDKTLLFQQFCKGKFSNQDNTFNIWKKPPDEWMVQSCGQWLKRFNPFNLTLLQKRHNLPSDRY